MRLAIVHDWLNQSGGAELVLEVLHRMYPQAPVFTSIYAPELMPPAYREWDIRTSFMQRLPAVARHHQPYLPLYPLAFRRFDLRGFDVVLSNSSGFCHGVRVPEGACHINYCLTPPRYLYNLSQYAERERLSAALRWLLPLLVAPLRGWDRRSVAGVDHFVGISQAVVERIRACYGREAALVYPPVPVERYAVLEEVEDYFLVVSRLVPYKRVDLAVRAFSRLGLPLLVVGEGRDRAALEALAGPSVTFAGRVPEAELPRLYGRCRAFVFPGEEDFGIAPLEAMACGRPVLAYAAGGALETVVEGETGAFFTQPTVDSLVEGVERLLSMDFDPQRIRRHAEGFRTAAFREKLGGFVAEKTGLRAAGSAAASG